MDVMISPEMFLALAVNGVKGIILSDLLTLVILEISMTCDLSF